MAQKYIDNFCFYSSIDEFLETDKKTFLAAMEENYPFVTPFRLSKAQIAAWADEYDVLREQLNKCVNKDRAYGRLSILFEYVLWDFDNENGVRPDVLILSKERIGIIEFKTRPIGEQDHKYITSQAKKYRHRLLHNHDESKGMKLSVCAVSTSMKDYYEILGHVRCISPDRFEDVRESLMGRHPQPHEDVYRWIASDYHFEKSYNEDTERSLKR
ncbi:MAG: hypothetical protein IIZ28_02365 [Erysipelotrichaceae bacterium]|nr:hypothetical protein [Erysipelotrichaceae bacterium]